MSPLERLLVEAVNVADERRHVAALRALQGLGEEALLTVEQLAERLAVSRAQVYRLGLSPAVRVGESPRFVFSQVIAELQRREGGGAAESDSGPAGVGVGTGGAP